MTPDRPLRVLHVAPTPFFSDRGCHIRIAGVVNASRALGVDSVVCTYHHGREMSGIRTERIGAISGYEDTRAGPNYWKIWADFKLLWLVVCTTWSEKPDVIHGHLHEGALIGWLTARMLFWRRIPVIADMQGSLTGELEAYGFLKPSGAIARLVRTLEYVIVRLPQHLTCSSRACRDSLRNEFGVPDRRLTLLSDRVDLDWFDEARAERQSGSGFEDADPVVVYSGSLLPAKGVETLWAVMREISIARPRVRFLLIGFPTDPTRKFIEESAVGDRCRLVGRVRYDQLPGYLADTDIGIDPKHSDSGEGSGKVVNYMAAGLAVAAYATHNNRELLGDEARLAPNCGSRALAERIIELVDNAALRRQEGEQNRQRVKRELSWSAGGRIIRELYDRALAGALMVAVGLIGTVEYL